MVPAAVAWDNADMHEQTYNALADWLTEVESTTSPAGFHGQIAGMWCRHTQLPDDLALDEVNRNTPAWAALLDYAAQVRGDLEDPACSFQPVLPPDNAPLAERVTALADWSAGLMFGVGSAGELDKDKASDEVKELLRDLMEICKISVEEDEDGEAEEAYTEIVEYLKVAAQTLYVELHPQAG